MSSTGVATNLCTALEIVNMEFAIVGYAMHTNKTSTLKAIFQQFIGFYLNKFEKRTYWLKNFETKKNTQNTIRPSTDCVV